MRTRIDIGNEHGFTLVESLIAMVIVVIILAGVYGLYTYMHKSQVSQEIKAALQAEARNTLDTMSRELMMAGYHGGDCPIIENGSNLIQFAEATQQPGMVGQTIRIRYRLNDTYLIREWRENSDSALFTSDHTKVIAQGVTGLAFEYRNKNGDILPFNADEGTRKDIRRISMVVTMQSSKVDPTTKSVRTTVFRADLVPRNLAEGEAAIDSIPPGTPTGLQVIDNQDCTSLELRWTKNPEPDVAGYYIMYGTQPGMVSGVVTVPVNQPGFNKDTPEYKLTGLVPTMYTSRFDASSVTRYYISLKAYDNSMNFSRLACAEVSGPPDSLLGTDYTSFGSGNDTILNPKRPAPPANIQAYNMLDNPTGLPWTNPPDAPDGRKQIRLTWTASPDATVGYRIYRSDTPFTTFPIPNSDGTHNYLIADETGTKGVTLGPATTTFLDTVDMACSDYYYAICTINCDNTQIYGGNGHPALYTSSDYALIGPAQAKSATGPPDPSLSGSKGGWKRVFLDLVNPSSVDCKDFTYTMLYFSDASMPYIGNDGKVYANNGGVPAPCDLVFDSSGTTDRGKFCEPASGIDNSFVFNSTTRNLGNYDLPELINNHTYYFLALAYDKCGNRSQGTGTAKTLATLCGDDPPGPPPPPTTVRADGCGDTITISWDWPTGPFIDWLDLQGYRLYRRTTDGDFSGTFDYNTGTPSGSTALRSTPLWGTSQDDLNIQDGGKYWYFVRATDCRWENIDASQSDYNSIKLNNITPYVPGQGTVVGPIYPGRIRRFQSDITDYPPSLTLNNDKYNFVTSFGVDPSSGSPTAYHNAVEFYLQNTSAGQATLNQLNLSWTNTGAYLKTIKIGGAPGTVAVDTYNFSPPVSATDMASGKTLTTLLSDSTALATGIGTYSSAIPVQLIFTNSDGTVSQATDMRGDTLNVVFKYENMSTRKDDCLAKMNAASGNPINVPGTPAIINCTQDLPTAGTNCFDVPGSTEPPHAVTDVHPVISGGRDCNITASIDEGETYNYHDPNSGNTTTQNVLFASKELYYAYTDQGATWPPAESSFSKVTDTNLSDNLLRFTIPGTVDKRVWFFIVVKTNSGNVDRLPEVQNGYYMYDQNAFNACDHTPNPPTNMVYSNGLMTWVAPDKYIDGSPIDTTQDPLTYSLYKKVGFTGSYGLLASGITTTNYTDSATITDNTFFKVQAANSCSTGAKLSDFSNEAAVCKSGTGGCVIIAVPNSVSLSTNWSTPSCSSVPIDIKVYVCGLAGNNNTDTLTVTAKAANNPGTSSMTFHERGDSGVFSYLGDGSDKDYVYLNSVNYSASTTDNVQGATTKSKLTDTVTFSASGCSDTTVSVTTDPCANTPGAPTLTYADKNGQIITLNWTAPTLNTDGSSLSSQNDIAYYKVYRAGVYINTYIAYPAVTIQFKPGSGSDSYSISAVDTCNHEGPQSAPMTAIKH